MHYTVWYTSKLGKQGESMDFTHRGASQTGAARSNGGDMPGGGSKRSKLMGGPLWLRIVWVVLLFSVTVVVVALAALLYFGGSKEAKLIDTDKQQAVFLTNGQVYFGKIKSINSKYIDLRDIYYLNVNQQVQPNQQQGNQDGQQNQNQGSVTLVKLGCSELHRPADQMLINRDQVTFWENLRDDGPVAKAIGEWLKQSNLDANKCKASS